MAGQGGADVENSLLIAQSQLQAVGIKADFQPLERGPLLEAITGRKFDLVSYGGGVYTVDPDSTSYVLMCQFIQPKGANNAGYSNPEVDELFIEGRAATDQAARAQDLPGGLGAHQRRRVARVAVRRRRDLRLQRQTPGPQTARRLQLRVLERPRVVASPRECGSPRSNVIPGPRGR